MIKIVELTMDNINELNSPNEPFDIIGHLDICLKDGVWSYTEMLHSEVTSKQYPSYDGAGPMDYIKAPDRIAYLAYEGELCVGQMLLAVSWNKYAHIEDISVRRDFRNRGIGRLLIERAVVWARERALLGLSIECQDNNLPASRFLSRCGFSVGGVNTRLYTNLGASYASETAVFWYKQV